MNTNDLLVIELSGTPRERGRIYGEAAKPLIANIVEGWRMDLGNYGRNSETAESIGPDDYLREFFSETDYLSSIKKWTPDLFEEVKGIAEGSGQTFDNILGIQLLDEEWIFGLRRRLDRPTTKCTAFGAPDHPDGVSYAGQNMDIPSWVEDNQVLIRVMPTENSPEALVFTMAGTIALNGLNASGLGVTCNTLSQLNHSVYGLPIAFIVRALLEQNTIDEAERFLQTINHASGQNYILSSLGDMRCFECCGGSAVRYAPENINGRVFHTNHPFVNKDRRQKETRKHMENSEARLNSICDRLGDVSQQVTLDAAKASLASHDDPANPVSRPIDNERISIGFTAGSSIYELGAVPRLHLASGPPCETDFELFEFKTL